MALPAALQVYAENIWRRFPEEFLALGCPHLEDAFELSSVKRQIVDSQRSRIVEIVLPRQTHHSVANDVENVTDEDYCSLQAVKNDGSAWQHDRDTMPSKDMQRASLTIPGLRSPLAKAKPSPDSSPTSVSTATSTPSRLAIRRGFHIQPYAESSDPFRMSAKVKAKARSPFSSARPSPDSSPTMSDSAGSIVSILAYRRNFHVEPFDKSCDPFRLASKLKAKETLETQDGVSPGTLLLLAARKRQATQSRARSQ